MPRVTIAIPLFNKERYIGETLESALHQTFRDIEVLVLDNCSTDRSFDIVSEHPDSRIRAIRQPTNIGMTGNFNSALELARGEYVKLLCADDLLAPESIAKQVEALDAVGPKAAIAVSQHDLISARGRRLIKSTGVPGMSGYYTGPEAVRSIRDAAGNIFGTEAQVLFRKSALTDIEWYREGFTEIDFYLRLLTAGGAVVIPESLSSVRLSKASASFRVAKTYAETFNSSLERAIESGRFGAIPPPSRTKRLRTAKHVAIFRAVQFVGARI
ncbi:MAG TPA: glycosyltransferase family 2 protein [Acidimicrobiales bacterium]|nr:glycosyltransferase family 2 protein [Acidimicrobiales bacterium]